MPKSKTRKKPRSRETRTRRGVDPRTQPKPTKSLGDLLRDIETMEMDMRLGEKD